VSLAGEPDCGFGDVKRDGVESEQGDMLGVGTEATSDEDGPPAVTAQPAVRKQDDARPGERPTRR
jgi:hypothetical protein